MKIHFIAIGGSAMHNLALNLHDQGHIVTGSDDEIYEPSRSRLANAGILPLQFGWYDEKITPNLDAVILGMHARKDNPELLRALQLDLPVFSYPEFVANQAKNKQKVVIVGSHGKTTTTSMVLHVFQKFGIETDYLVGAQLKGFDRMVNLSDAPNIVLEGDEYLSSPIDLTPKMLHYDADVAVLNGIAWDHINVFPTFEQYKKQFQLFAEKMPAGATLFYYDGDPDVIDVIENSSLTCEAIPYNRVAVNDEKQAISKGKTYELSVIGEHNLQNMAAAKAICSTYDVSDHDFFEAIADFEGAARRLQFVKKGSGKAGHVILDFAHAPSKVKATTEAVKKWYGMNTQLVAVLELHTFSSLNKDFLPQYNNALKYADHALVMYSQHTLEMKKMPPLSKDFLKECFQHPNLKVVVSQEELREVLGEIDYSKGNVLMMSSGRFDGFDLNKL